MNSKSSTWDKITIIDQSLNDNELLTTLACYWWSIIFVLENIRPWYAFNCLRWILFTSRLDWFALNRWHFLRSMRILCYEFYSTRELSKIKWRLIIKVQGWLEYKSTSGICLSSNEWLVNRSEHNVTGKHMKAVFISSHLHI